MSQWRKELEETYSGEGAFLTQLHCVTDWDWDTYYRLTDAMVAACKSCQSAEKLDREVTQIFWYVGSQLRVETGGRKEYEAPFYREAIEYIHRLVDWFFDGTEPGEAAFQSRQTSELLLPQTYEEYIHGAEEMARHDVIAGKSVYRRTTIAFQQVVLNITLLFDAYAKASRTAKALLPPCDVLIAREPLQIRQPDGLLMSRERHDLLPPPDTVAPISPAPELVVEVFLPHENRAGRMSKIADYSRVNVRECWLVSLSGETVETLRLSPDGAMVRIGLHGQGDTVTSEAFPGLFVAVSDIFEE